MCETRSFRRRRSGRRAGRLWRCRSLERSWGRGRERRLAAAAGLRDLGKLGARGEQPQVLNQPLRELVRLRIALQMANGVCAADRIRLAEEVVAQPDLGVGVRAADLLQRGARPGAHLVGADAQERADVVVALPAEQELEHRALFLCERHGRGSVGQRGDG
jgi:hypothetical protein